MLIIYNKLKCFKNKKNMNVLLVTRFAGNFNVNISKLNNVLPNAPTLQKN